MYIIVAGGGKVGYYTTKMLVNEGYEVLLIERDAEKVAVYQQRFGPVAIAGDAAEAATLEAAGAGRADVVIAVTGEDEDNLVICQVAKRKYNVGRTIARVNNPKNEELFRKLGVDVTVSQTNHILHLIEQAIPDRSFVHLTSLRHADVSIVDARITEDSAVANHEISGLDLPANCVIAAISRGPNILIPRGETTLLPGDDVIAVTTREHEADLRKLLTS
ncbi:MAG: TrkA family potassium uptake protein [Thermomicrobiales bacterium]|nr:TrkA family potassium uptake protein [Thermomicrobiales bacterium]